MPAGTGQAPYVAGRTVTTRHVPAQRGLDGARPAQRHFCVAVPVMHVEPLDAALDVDPASEKGIGEYLLHRCLTLEQQGGEHGVREVEVAEFRRDIAPPEVKVDRGCDVTTGEQRLGDAEGA